MSCFQDAGTFPDVGDFFPCAKCGKTTHINDLDAKPEPRVNEYLGQWIVRAIYLGWMRWVRRWPGCSAWDDPDGNTNWERFECGECYGPGYVSNRDHANDV